MSSNAITNEKAKEMIAEAKEIPDLTQTLRRIFDANGAITDEETGEVFNDYYKLMDQIIDVDYAVSNRFLRGRSDDEKDLSEKELNEKNLNSLTNALGIRNAVKSIIYGIINYIQEGIDLLLSR